MNQPLVSNMGILTIARDTENARIIEVFGNDMLPLYRHGDRLIVSEKAPMKVGDRVVVCTASTGYLGGTLVHRSSKYVTLNRGGRSDRDITINVGDMGFIGRVIWASQ